MVGLLRFETKNHVLSRGLESWSSGFVWEEAHVLKVVGSNPSTLYWMDIFSLICCKNCIQVCLKRPTINEKEAGDGPFKNPILN